MPRMPEHTDQHIVVQKHTLLLFRRHGSGRDGETESHICEQQNQSPSHLNQLSAPENHF